MSVFLCASLLALVAPLPAAAQEVHDFNVAAQTPASAIRAFSEQSGIAILASADDLKDKKFNRVSGEIATEQALDFLLAGTGLRHRYVGDRAVALLSDASKSVDSPPAAANGPAGAPAAGTALNGAILSAQATEGISSRNVPDSGADGAPSTQGEETIVVTGIRESLFQAQELKRDASVNIEAITAQDLGKFTDSSIADALARVPGLQVDRNDGNFTGDRASIRGLGAAYVQTTLNGRSVISSGDQGSANQRSFNFDSVPSEILNGVVIYKSPAAEQVDPGLGGAIDLKTLRPLDYRPKGSASNYFGGVAVTESYENLSERLSARESAFAGGKFLDATLGAYIAAVRSPDQKSRQDYINEFPNFSTIQVAGPNGGSPATIPNVLVPTTWSIQTNDRTIKREAFSGGIQWKPNEQWDVNADYTTNIYDTYIHADSLGIGTTGTGGVPGSLGGLWGGVFQPGGVTLKNNQVVGFDATRISYPPGMSYMPTYGFAEFQQNYQSRGGLGGLNVAWNSGPWSAAVDYGHSDLAFTQDLPLPFSNGTPLPSLIYNSSGGLPRFAFPSTAYLDTPAVLAPVTTFYRQNNALKGSRDNLRLDLAYSLSDSIKLQFGGRTDISKLDYRSSTAYANLSDPPPLGPGLTPAQIAAYNQAIYPGTTAILFSDSRIPGIPVQQINFQAGCGVIPTWCSLAQFGKGALAGPFPTTIPPSPTASDPFTLYPQGSYLIKETSSALYAQIDAKSEIAGMPISGNFGVRAFHEHVSGLSFDSVTPYDGIGSSVIGPSVGNSVAESNSYWKLLPSLNILLHPREDLNVRFAAGETLTLPQYQLLSPENTTNIRCTTCTGYTPNILDTSSAGNTRLRPTTAWNYDFTAEYYLANGGAIIGSAFYKNVKDLILPGVSTIDTLPGFGAKQFLTTEPANVGKGSAYGFELGANFPFTFLSAPLDGFGVQGNYTYTASSFKAPPGINSLQTGTTFGFPGSSKNNFNGTVYYEKYGLGARLALNYRSDYLASYGDGGYYTFLPTSTRGQTTVDASLDYQVLRHLQLIATATNLTNQDRRDYTFDPDVVRNYADRPRTYSVGFRVAY